MYGKCGSLGLGIDRRIVREMVLQCVEQSDEIAALGEC
jgi:hypothetical protein